MIDCSSPNTTLKCLTIVVIIPPTVMTPQSELACLRVWATKRWARLMGIVALE